MHRNALPEFDVNEEEVRLLFSEVDHRIHNILAMIEAAVRLTESSNVEDYRAKLMEPILGLRRLYQEQGWSFALRELKALIEKTARPHCANGARLVVSGPNIVLDPNLALTLHLTFHELALNAKKYGALSSSDGCVTIIWKIRCLPGEGRKLEILWKEHDGPEVERARQQGFGLRLIEKSIMKHGRVRLRFSPAGLSCFMSIDLNRKSGGRKACLESP